MTRHYVAVALVIKILVSLQFYAGWPFDDLCKTDDVSRMCVVVASRAIRVSVSVFALRLLLGFS